MLENEYPEIYSLLNSGQEYINSNDETKAISLFNKAYKLCKLLDDPLDIDDIKMQIILFYYQLGEKDVANEIIDSLWSTYSKITAEMLIVNKIESLKDSDINFLLSDAMGMIRKLQKDLEKQKFFNEIIEIYIRKNKQTEALRIIQFLDENLNKIKKICFVSISYNRLGFPHDAKQTFLTASEVAKRSSNNINKKEAQYILNKTKIVLSRNVKISKQAKIDIIELLFQDAKDIAHKSNPELYRGRYPKCSPIKETIIDIAEVYIQLKMYDKAKKLLNDKDLFICPNRSKEKDSEPDYELSHFKKMANLYIEMDISDEFIDIYGSLDRSILRLSKNSIMKEKHIKEFNSYFYNNQYNLAFKEAFILLNKYEISTYLANILNRYIKNHLLLNKNSENKLQFNINKILDLLLRNKKSDQSMFIEIADLYSLLGQHSKSNEILNTVLTSDIWDAKKVPEIYFRNGNISKALESADIYCESSYKFFLVASNYIKNKKISKALRIINYEDLGEYIHEVPVIFAENDEFDITLDLIDKDIHIDSNILRNIINIFIANHKFSSISDLLLKRVKYSTESSSLFFIRDIVHTTLPKDIINSFVDSAYSIIQSGQPSDDKAYSSWEYTKVAFIDAYRDLGKIEQALNIIYSIKSAYSRDGYLSYISEIMIMNGQIEKVLHIVNKIDGSYQKETVLSATINAYISSDKFNKALSVLEQYGIRAINCEALAMIAEEYISLGNIQSAINLLDEKEDCTKILLKIFTYHVHMAHYSEAFRLLNNHKVYPQYFPEFIYPLIKDFEKHHNRNQTVGFTKDIKDEEFQVVYLIKITQFLSDNLSEDTFFK